MLAQSLTKNVKNKIIILEKPTNNSYFRLSVTQNWHYQNIIAFVFQICFLYFFIFFSFEPSIQKSAIGKHEFFVKFLYHFDEIVVEVRMLDAMCNCIDHCKKDALSNKKLFNVCKQQ